MCACLYDKQQRLAGCSHLWELRETVCATVTAKSHLEFLKCCVAEYVDASRILTLGELVNIQVWGLTCVVEIHTAAFLQKPVDGEHEGVHTRETAHETDSHPVHRFMSRTLGSHAMAGFYNFG